MLDFWKRQERQIGNIRQDIQNHDDAGANQKRADKIASRIAHFAAKKRDVGPGGLSENRTDHRLAQKENDCEAADELKPGLCNLRTPTVRPRIPPRRRSGRAGRAPAEQEPDGNNSSERRSFCKSECVLDERTQLKPARVRPGQQRDQPDRGQLLSR